MQISKEKLKKEYFYFLFHILSMIYSNMMFFVISYYVLIHFLAQTEPK